MGNYVLQRVTELNQERDVRGKLTISVLMFVITTVAMVVGNTLAFLVLGINAGCWYVMAGGARRDLREIRESAPPEPSKRAHTGMYRGGY